MMKTVKVSVPDLRERIEKNMRAHRAVFESAWSKYQEDCVAWLERSLELARSGRRVGMYFGEQAPSDHTGDYKQAILMLEMHQGETIEISYDHFKCFVMDEWGWRQQWISNKYIGASMPTSVNEL